MQRKIFLFLEKLQISRRERVALGFLSGILLLLGTLNLLLEEKAVYDPAYYEELEQVFSERSRAVEKERNEILARYEPVEAAGIEDRIGGRDSADGGLGNHETGTDAADGYLSAGMDSTDSESGLSGDSVESQGLLVNINTATDRELQKLPGIGPAYAGRIVDRRRNIGPFTSINQLTEIRGIGEKRLDNLKSMVTVGDSLKN